MQRKWTLPAPCVPRIHCKLCELKNHCLRLGVYIEVNRRKEDENDEGTSFGQEDV
jgi:hypothetical protein